MRELWTATVEVLTVPSDSGDTKAFTNVVTWASSADEHADSVRQVFEEYGWTVIGIEECRPISSCGWISKELADLVNRASDNPNACIYGTFHYHPSKPS
jgi:hypothetical protein